VADPQVGTIWRKRTGGPAYTQPGGPGTPTIPTQPPSQQPPTVPYYVGPPQEHLGRFYPGCGHSIMSYEVAQDTVNGAPAALVLCPLCGYIQNIYQPPSLLDGQDIVMG